MQAQPAASPPLPPPQASVCTDTAQLWVRFKTGGDLLARQALIERHLGFARYVASRCYAQRMRDGIAFSDYMQLASVGLIEAVDRFQPSRGDASFETYASHRIRGAVLNGLTTMSEVNAQIEAQRRTHRARLASLAEHEPDLKSDFEHFADLATGMSLGFMLDDLRIFQTAEGICDDNFYADAEMRKLRDTLKRLIATLPDRESQLIQAHYFQDLPFDSMAETMGVTKGRISQLHKRALGTLQSRLATACSTDWLA